MTTRKDLDLKYFEVVLKKEKREIEENLDVIRAEANPWAQTIADSQL